MDSLALSSHNWKYNEEMSRAISYSHFWLMFEDLQQMAVHFSSHKEWRLLSTVKWKTELLDKSFHTTSLYAFYFVKIVAIEIVCHKQSYFRIDKILPFHLRAFITENKFVWFFFQTMWPLEVMQLTVLSAKKMMLSHS